MVKYEKYQDNVDEFNKMMNVESILPLIYDLKRKLSNFEST